MSKAKVPLEVKHSWEPDKRKEPYYKGRYYCPDCECWTANLPLYKDEVCEAKDRRTGKADRRRQ